MLAQLLFTLLLGSTDKDDPVIWDQSLSRQ